MRFRPIDQTGGLVVVMVFVASASPSIAWDETGHAIVTEIAVSLLPEDMPAWVTSSEARRRLVYLSAEPDRWRGLDDPPMGQLNKPDHYFDVDLLRLYGVSPESLPTLRYEYLRRMILHKAEHPDTDYGYDAAKDREGAYEWPGFAPYRVAELYVILRSSWRTLNTYQQYADVAGKETLEACRANVIHNMGLMSHYVGDLAQPLHTTQHHHGWVGDNPKDYTTDRGFHAHIDEGVIADGAITIADCLQREPKSRSIKDREAIFGDVLAYMLETFGQVEAIYALEKEGAFTKDHASFDKGTDFIEQRLCAGGSMLAGLWTAAREEAGIDSYREHSLKARREAAEIKKASTAPAQ